MFEKFKAYQSKPITRMALEIQAGTEIVEVETNTYSYDGITFKAYEQPKEGDFICRLTMDDTYHVSRTVFMERNVVA